MWSKHTHAYRVGGLVKVKTSCNSNYFRKSENFMHFVFIMYKADAKTGQNFSRNIKGGLVKYQTKIRALIQGWVG